MSGNRTATPSIRYELYEETIGLIRAHKDCDVCINITSSGNVDGPDEERIEPHSAPASQSWPPMMRALSTGKTALCL